MFTCTQRNLGERARGLALRSGVLFAGVALIGGLAVFEFGARSFGWLLALPIALSVYGLASATFGICAYHGLRGQRGADHGPEAVLDYESRSRMRLRALFAVSASVVIGFAFAAAFVATV